jgi:hypothetical protein
MGKRIGVFLQPRLRIRYHRDGWLPRNSAVDVRRDECLIVRDVFPTGTAKRDPRTNEEVSCSVFRRFRPRYQCQLKHETHRKLPSSYRLDLVSDI